MLPEEYLEQKHYDPSPPFKNWRYTQWRLEMGRVRWKEQREAELRQVRYLTLREMLRRGEWWI